MKGKKSGNKGAQLKHKNTKEADQSRAPWTGTVYFSGIMRMRLFRPNPHSEKRYLEVGMPTKVPGHTTIIFARDLSTDGPAAHQIIFEHGGKLPSDLRLSVPGNKGIETFTH